MPTSSHKNILPFLNMIRNNKNEIQDVLEIGVGFGKYGVLIREYLEIYEKARYDKENWRLNLIGVEIFKNYKNPIHDYIYDHIYYTDILTIINDLPNFDLILLVDVIEHIEKDRAAVLLRELIQKMNICIFVCHPDGNKEDALLQDEAFGNKYEAHISRWTKHDYDNIAYTIHIDKTSKIICKNEAHYRRICNAVSPRFSKIKSVLQKYKSVFQKY